MGSKQIASFALLRALFLASPVNLFTKLQILESWPQLPHETAAVSIPTLQSQQRQEVSAKTRQNPQAEFTYWFYKFFQSFGQRGLKYPLKKHSQSSSMGFTHRSASWATGTSFFHLATRSLAKSPTSSCFLRLFTVFPTPVSFMREPRIHVSETGILTPAKLPKESVKATHSLLLQGRKFLDLSLLLCFQLTLHHSLHVNQRVNSTLVKH